MIALDIPMPERCLDCPCSYQIRTGTYRGLTMCQAMECREPGHTEMYYIVEELGRRPDRCVMREIEVIYSPK